MNTRINSLTEGTISTADWFPIDGPNGTKKLSTGLIAASIGNAAAEYDSTETYNDGDYCTHDGIFYVCNDDSVTGAWDAAKWDETTAADGLAQLKEEKVDSDDAHNVARDLSYVVVSTW